MTALGRAWCFTLNNPDEDEVLIPQSWDPSDYRYLVYQLEEGENKTKHLQGYVSLNKPMRFGTFKKWFPGEKAHIEAAKGSAKQNQKYCTKEEGRIAGPWEFGKIPEPGKRSDLLATKELLDAGGTMQELSQEFYAQFVRYHRSFKEYKLINTEGRNEAKEIYVLWGSTGTGKSRFCWDNYPGAYWKTKNSGKQQFWDGYTGQEVIIVDEFYGWLSFDFMLRFTDRYPVNLDIKHGTIPCTAKTIVFTSNKHPEEWYPNSKYGWDDSNPLRRRITEVRRFGKDDTVVPPADIPTDKPIDNTEELRLDELYMNHLKCRLKK